MPGFMGIRGMEHKNPRDMEKERREENKGDSGRELAKRSREKVQEILRDQDGDMSAYSGGGATAVRGECQKIAAQGIEKIMSGRVAVLSFDDTLLTVQGIFASVKFRHLPVVDEHGRIIGIISDRDFLRVASPFFGTINEQTRDKEIMARKVGVIMTRNPLCVGVGTTILEAIKLMNRKKISCLPIVEMEDKKLLGIVTWKDIVRAFCPAGFGSAADSNRLRTGVHINPESSESARLRAKSAESARLRARENPAPSQGERSPAAISGGTKAAPPPRPTAPANRSSSDTEHMARPGAEDEKPVADVVDSKPADVESVRLKKIEGEPRDRK